MFVKIKQIYVKMCQKGTLNWFNVLTRGEEPLLTWAAWIAHYRWRSAKSINISTFV